MTEVSPNVKNLPLEEIKEEEEHRFGNSSTLVDPKKEAQEEESAPLTGEQKKILVAMLLSIGMTQTLYMNIATLLPLECDEIFGRHEIPESLLALVIAMFEIAYIISAPIIGQTL